MTVLLAVSAIVLVLRLIQPLFDLYQQRAQVAKVFMADFQTRVLPDIRVEATKLYKDDLEAWINTEMRKTAEKRMPELLHAFETEGYKLLDSLATEFETNLKGRAEKFNARYLERFKKEFPQLAEEKDAEVVLKNLQTSLNNASDRVLADFFKVHHDSMMRMGADFDRIVVPTEVSEMSNDQLVQHALGLLAEMFAERFDVASEVRLDSPGKAATATASN